MSKKLPTHSLCNEVRLLNSFSIIEQNQKKRLRARKMTDQIKNLQKIHPEHHTSDEFKSGWLF
jgi:hypothetical protein